jgi:hypothetical protein
MVLVEVCGKTNGRPRRKVAWAVSGGWRVEGIDPEIRSHD